MRAVLSSTVILMSITDAFAALVAPSVSIPAGTLQGGQCSGSSDAIYFKSIPYAQPPIDDLRFAPPVPYNGTYPEGQLSATSSAPGCIQFGSEFAVTGPTAEDCLYLDIWTPSNATNSSALPVKVWIYGGGESAGGISDPMYDGCNLAQEDALFVSINYRLGSLGFLALESAGIRGNQGILDLLLGLQWIQDNIAAFGGNPKKVLLFGQSAGATNAFVIATLPQAPSLINAAITESGGGRDAELNATIQQLSADYARNLSCGISDISCLQSASVSALKNSFNVLPAQNSGFGMDGAIGVNNANTSQFAPYVDGKIIATQPSQIGVQVPTIFGSNALEGSLFALGQFASVGAQAVTQADYTTFLQDNFGTAASLVEKYYPLANFSSTPYPAFYAISKVLTDSTYLCSAYRGLNRAVENKIPVWTYFWDHVPACTWTPELPQEAVQLVGATHTSEIPFVFGNLDDLPAPNGTCNSTAQEQAMSKLLINAWTAMASSGDPSTAGLTWPQYMNSSTAMGVYFVNNTAAGGIEEYSVCALWDQVREQLLASDNATSSSNGSTSTGTGNATSSSTATNGASWSTSGRSFNWVTAVVALAVFPLTWIVFPI